MSTKKKITDSQMTEANNRKKAFDENCNILERLIKQDTLGYAHLKIMQMLKEEYGEHCVDMWALRYFLQIGNGTTVTRFDNLIKTYMEKDMARIYHNKEGELNIIPVILTVDESSTFQSIYKELQQKNPDMDKASVLSYIATKTLENIAE